MYTDVRDEGIMETKLKVNMESSWDIRQKGLQVTIWLVKMIKFITVFFCTQAAVFRGGAAVVLLVGRGAPRW